MVCIQHKGVAKSKCINDYDYVCIDLYNFFSYYKNFLKNSLRNKQNISNQFVLIFLKWEMKIYPIKKISTRMGFEPTRAEHIGLAVQRLNHSATSSSWGRSSAQCQSTTWLELSSTPAKCSHAGSRTRAFWVKARYPSR